MGLEKTGDAANSQRSRFMGTIPRVLILGCSLDRHMVDYCMEQEKCRPTGEDFQMIMHPGATSPPYWHAYYWHIPAGANTSYEVVDKTAGHYCNRGYDPPVVIVSSDLWDIAAWYEQLGKKINSGYADTAHFEKWANEDLPNFMSHV